ncbi:DIL domain-containing protein [Melanogaster broomeanus]|nr:DIL domain-containing protein [Melanogaster broomeanus]
MNVLVSLDLTPEPDLHPLYPSPAQIANLLSPHSGLDPSQKTVLLSHCLSRACLFSDLALLQYLLTDHQAQPYVDLGARDEDGLGLISQAIQGFGSESDRDVEREECVRLLIVQGTDVLNADNAGWTPLHHAAVLAPPTLVSHLMTHGCSPFSVTKRQLTPLDIVTAHTLLPGREDVALLLEESMRSEGWTGGRMEQRRRALDEQLKRKDRQKDLRDSVAKILDVPTQWWQDGDSDISSTESDSEEDDDFDEDQYTPPSDFTSMLAWSPRDLDNIFHAVVTSSQMSARNAQPANALYLMARFACLTCDATWLEDLILGATDVIEERFFSRSEDVTCLIFWLYNVTVWLHLMQCDDSINDACEMLGSFELMEQVINSVFVFIIRFAERRIDQLLDAALLEYAPLSSELDGVQFESDWSFLRPFSAKKKVTTPITPSSSTPLRNGTPSSPPFLPARSRSPSLINLNTPAPVTPKALSSLRQTLSRARTPVNAVFGEPSPSKGLRELISFLTALHTLLTLSDVNPAFITQFWSQVMYWTSSEIFNRVLTRKKYLCRSRAIQVGMNLTVLEEWIDDMGLPRGIASHFSPVRDLLTWLQRLSSINDFSDLVATIQTMKSINPLQMRRAVRDYKYEVNEGRMTDECMQYLTQLQKDWERHRVKMGVEALRKELGERERERERDLDDGSVTDQPAGAKTPSISMSETSATLHNIDLLFDRTHDRSSWEPAKAPQVLGELLDSRYMLPLFLPSDPRMLSAAPVRRYIIDYTRRTSSHQLDPRSSSHTGIPRPVGWKCRSRRVRDVSVEALRWLDGFQPSRWARPIDLESQYADNDRDSSPPPSVSDAKGLRIDTDIVPVPSHSTPLTRKPSSRSKNRLSLVGDQFTPFASPS